MAAAEEKFDDADDEYDEVDEKDDEDSWNRDMLLWPGSLLSKFWSLGTSLSIAGILIALSWRIILAPKTSSLEADEDDVLGVIIRWEDCLDLVTLSYMSSRGEAMMCVEGSLIKKKMIWLIKLN